MTIPRVGCLPSSWGRRSAVEPCGSSAKLLNRKIQILPLQPTALADPKPYCCAESCQSSSPHEEASDQCKGLPWCEDYRLVSPVVMERSTYPRQKCVGLTRNKYRTTRLCISRRRNVTRRLEVGNMALMLVINVRMSDSHCKFVTAGCQTSDNQMTYPMHLLMGRGV